MNNFLSKYHKLLFLYVLGLFVFIPLYPKFPLANVSGTFVAIRLEDILIALSYLLWVFYIYKAKKIKSFLSDRLNQTILLFFFIGLVSVFSATFLTKTVSFHLSLLHFLRRVEFIMLLPLVSSVVASRKQLTQILSVLGVVLLVVNVYGLGQQYLDWPVISTTNSEFSKGLILRLTPDARVNSTFAGHYDLAVFLAMGIILITSLFFRLSKPLKFFALILGGLTLFVLIMTAARLSFAAALIGILLTLFWIRKKRYILLIIFAALLILVYPSQLRDRLISTITVNLFHQGQRYQGKTEDQRIRSKLNIPTLSIQTSSQSASTSSFAQKSGQTPTDITPGEPVDTTQLGVYRSFAIRFNLEWPRAITAFFKNPFLGTGYSSIGIATDNDFLRSLGEVGFLGTWAFELVLIVLFKKVWNIFKNSSGLQKYFSAGTLAVVAAFLFNSLFIDVFEASKVASIFWMLTGLCLSITNFKND